MHALGLLSQRVFRSIDVGDGINVSFSTTQSHLAGDVLWGIGLIEDYHADLTICVYLHLAEDVLVMGTVKECSPNCCFRELER